MKSFVIIALLVALVGVNANEDQKQKAQEHVQHCIEDTGIESEAAKKLVYGDFTINDEKAQCFAKCFFKRVGFMNEAGEPQKDVIISKLSAKEGVKFENLDAIITKCVEEKGANDCETAYKIFQCYWTKQVAAV